MRKASGRSAEFVIWQMAVELPSGGTQLMK